MPSLTKPVFPAPRTADLKRGLDQIAEYVDDVQERDGDLDVDSLTRKIEKTTTEHVKTPFKVITDDFSHMEWQTRKDEVHSGEVRGKFQVPDETLDRRGVQTVMNALIDAKLGIDILDADGDGALQLDEISAAKLGGLAGELATASAGDVVKGFDNDMEAWVDVVYGAKFKIDRRRELDSRIIKLASHHASSHLEAAVTQSVGPWSDYLAGKDLVGHEQIDQLDDDE